MWRCSRTRRPSEPVGRLDRYGAMSGMSHATTTQRLEAAPRAVDPRLPPVPAAVVWVPAAVMGHPAAAKLDSVATLTTVVAPLGAGKSTLLARALLSQGGLERARWPRGSEQAAVTLLMPGASDLQ
jgi:hypothetical protein